MCHELAMPAHFLWGRGGGERFLADLVKAFCGSRVISDSGQFSQQFGILKNLRPRPRLVTPPVGLLVHRI